MLMRLLWGKLIEAAKRTTDQELRDLVLALERALENDAEQPFEVAFRLLRLKGPTMRVAVEDLGKLIHDYNNALAIRQALESDVVELKDRLKLLEPTQRVSTMACPYCSTTFSLGLRT